MDDRTKVTVAMQENGDAELVYTGNRRYKPALLIMPDNVMSIRYRLSLYAEGKRYGSDQSSPAESAMAEDFYSEIYRAANSVVKSIVADCHQPNEFIKRLSKYFPDFDADCIITTESFQDYLEDVTSAKDFQTVCFVTEEYFGSKDTSANSITKTNRFNTQYTMFYDIVQMCLGFVADCIDHYGLQKSFSICYDHRFKTPVVVGFMERSRSKKCS